MSAPRRSLGRFPLTLVIACGVVWCWALPSCIKRTPGYCEKTADCGMHEVCVTDIHTCTTNLDASDAAQGDTGSDLSTVMPDGGIDRAPDAAPDLTADTAGDGSGGDRADAVDAFLGCTPDAGCGGDKPACETMSHTCVQCVRSDDCHAAGARVCDTVAHQCVQCLQSSDCTNAYTPVCETNKMCRGCTRDSECAGVGPEVCMLLDGHCATDDETVYVNNVGGTGCPDGRPEAGSRLTPFCNTQAAINAALAPLPPPDDGAGDAAAPDGGADADAGADKRARTLKTLVLMLGSTNPFGDITFDGGMRTLTVVGRSAIIAPPHIGITVTSGTLYARDLTVSTTGVFTGIVATGGEIHLDRMKILSNRGGGISLNNAAFSITNSVIAKNGQGTFTTASMGSSYFSGIAIGSIPGTGPARVASNTIADNAVGGLVCVSGSSGISATRPLISGLLFWGNSNNADISGCTETPCCVDPQMARINPMFADASTLNYHLLSGSMCRATVPATLSSPPYDLDGDPRPASALSDCGADQYAP